MARGLQVGLMAVYTLPKPKTSKAPAKAKGAGGDFFKIKYGVPFNPKPKGGGRAAVKDPVTIKVKTKIDTKDRRLSEKLKEQRRFDKKAKEMRKKTGVDKPPIIPPVTRAQKAAIVKQQQPAFIREGLLSKAAKTKVKPKEKPVKSVYQVKEKLKMRAAKAKAEKQAKAKSQKQAQAKSERIAKTKAEAKAKTKTKVKTVTKTAAAAVIAVSPAISKGKTSKETPAKDKRVSTTKTKTKAPVKIPFIEEDLKKFRLKRKPTKKPVITKTPEIKTKAPPVKEPVTAKAVTATPDKKPIKPKEDKFEKGFAEVIKEPKKAKKFSTKIEAATGKKDKTTTTADNLQNQQQAQQLKQQQKTPSATDTKPKTDSKTKTQPKPVQAKKPASTSTTAPPAARSSRSSKSKSLRLPKDKEARKNFILLSGNKWVKRLQWRQGAVYRQADLTTGRLSSTNKPVLGGVNKGFTPRDTLKAIQFSEKKPKKREVRMGVTTAFVQSKKRITFRRAG